MRYSLEMSSQYSNEESIGLLGEYDPYNPLILLNAEERTRTSTR